MSRSAWRRQLTLDPASQMLLFLLNHEDMIHINQWVGYAASMGFSANESIAAVDRLGRLGLIESYGGHCVRVSRTGRWKRAG